MGKEEIYFDYDKLSKSDKALYDRLDDNSKIVFQKDWINVEKQRIKLAQKKARLDALRHRENEKERKARTKRLIEIGASVESVLGRPIEKEDLPKLIAFLKTQEERGQFFSKAMARSEENNLDLNRYMEG